MNPTALVSTKLACRGCGRTPAETGDAVSPLAVAFTCARCLMAGTDSRPTCGRCLGSHWSAACGYNATEAKAAHAARSAAGDQHPAAAPLAPAESKIAKVADVETATCGAHPTNKASRRGRPSVDPDSKRRRHAARQAAYRARQGAL